MPIKWMTSGSGRVLDVLTQRHTPDDFLLHLYQNDHTPAAGDTLASFTEATYTGYAAQTLTGWSVPVISGDGHAQEHVDGLDFHLTAPGTTTNQIYGFYLTYSGVLMGGERFTFAPAPFTTIGAGVMLSIVISAITEF